MIVTGVWRRVGFSNLKIARAGHGFKNCGTRAESGSKKVSPATFGLNWSRIGKLEKISGQNRNPDPKIFEQVRSLKKFDYGRD